jgi:hypothetical protein
MAAAIPILSVAATVVSAIGYLQAGSAQQRASRYNEAQAQQNAQIARTQGVIDEGQKRREIQKIIGFNRAQYGASGVAQEGTPLDVLADIASEGERDIQTIRYNTAVKASGYESTAQLEGMRGRDAQTAGYLGAGRAILMHDYDANRTGAGYKIPTDDSAY